MSNTTRRNFLGLLAHLPLVGALFAVRPRQRSPEVAERIRRGREKVLAERPIDVRLQELTDEALRKAQAEVRFIRWIPVTERLPEPNGANPAWSNRVLVFEPSANVLAHQSQVRTCRLMFAKGSSGWRDDYQCMALPTHWAPLPAPPTEVPA